MPLNSSLYATNLRRELAARNRCYAVGRLHVETCGSDPVIVYAPEGDCHGNFFGPAFTAIQARPDWNKRFQKVHTQGRSLPRLPEDPARKWRELDSCMSSDALLMNVFCTPGVAESGAVRGMLGVDASDTPVFGWKARVPLTSGLMDRTEVDMRWGSLLVEAKLTESDFQKRTAAIVEGYRDFDEVFDRDRLPRITRSLARRKQAIEFPEDFTQEWENTASPEADADSLSAAHQAAIVARAELAAPSEIMYEGYQLIRNVLAAYANEASFCVIYDERRPDLREAWFQILSAVKSAEMRTRLKALTWQELTTVLPADLQTFLNQKYAIVPPGQLPTEVHS